MKFCQQNLGLIMIGVLVSCSGGSDSSTVGKNGAQVSSAASVSLAEAKKEISSVSNELNQSANYPIEKSELDTLLAEGTITQAQYTELLALAK